jgi:hypothetical protein
MEAIAYGQTALRVNNELRTGHVYYIRGIGFQLAETLARRLLHNDYYTTMHSWTQIDLAGPTISIPMLPDRFMTFSCVATLTNRQLAGA